MEPVVYVVDDDAAVRQSLSLLLKSVGLRTQSFESAAAFLAAWNEDQPGCLVLDIRMPGMSGLELQTRLLNQALAPPIIFITGHGDVSMAVRAMREGAVEFLKKPFDDQALLDSIYAALRRDEARRVQVYRWRAEAARFDELSARERDVLEAVVAGKSNKVIAHELGLSERTIEIHRGRVMSKTGAESLAELVRLVLQVRAGEPH